MPENIWVYLTLESMGRVRLPKLPPVIPMDFLDKSRNKRDEEARNVEQRRIKREKPLRDK
jgi:hypothetical protein